MRYRELIERIAERTGLTVRQSEQLLSSTVVAIARQLRAYQANELAEELPGPLATDVTEAQHLRTRGIAPLLEQIAFIEPGSLSFTAEHAAVVCEALAEALRPAALHALREALSDDVAALLEAREAPAPFQPVHLDRSHHTLAEGEPGGTTPLYLARAGYRRQH